MEQLIQSDLMKKIIVIVIMSLQEKINYFLDSVININYLIEVPDILELTIVASTFTDCYSAYSSVTMGM